MMKLPGLKSIRSRVLLLVFFTSGLIWILALTLAVHLGENVFFNIDDHALRERISDIDRLLHENSNSNYLKFKIKEDWGNRGLQKVFGLVQGENAVEYLATPHFPNLAKSELLRNPHDPQSVQTIDDGKSLYRAMLKETTVSGKKFIILVLIDRTVEKEFFQKSKRLGLYLALVISLLSITITDVLVRFLLNPIEQLRKEVLKLHMLPNGYRLSDENVPSELILFIHQTNELLKQLEIVIEKNKRFATDIAHEMRNPIHQARMALEVGLQSSHTVDDLKDVVVDSLEQMQRLSRLVADMLFLARVERGLEPLPLTEVNLLTELEDLIDYYQVIAEDKNQTIKLGSHSPLTLSVRPELFRRAIGNIIENAIRYSTGPACTEVSFHKSESEVMIEIKDEGMGIPPEQKDKLFSTSYRTDGSKVFSREGLGLGLSIVKAIMDLHGGRMEMDILHIAPVKGSTLRLVFPLKSV